MFCPPVECPLAEQFRLHNDCCTYCKSHDFCAPSEWAATKLPRCHSSAQCTNLAPFAAVNVSRKLANETVTASGATVNSMFSCKCLPGFQGDGRTWCEDVDECADQRLNDCDAQSTRCLNTPGSFKCKCKPGFKPISLAAAVAPPAELASGREQQLRALSSLLDHASLPVVRAGEKQALQRCQDINECSDGKLNRCHLQAKCINLPGSYKCQCKRGYLGNGFECHKWFSSDVSVAAYLHRHTEGQRANASSPHFPAAPAAWPPRVNKPLNDDDEDPENDDDPTDARSAYELVEGAQDEEEQQLEDLYDSSAAPKLSDSKWEPLRFSFNSQEQDGAADESNRTQQVSDSQLRTAPEGPLPAP